MNETSNMQTFCLIHMLTAVLYTRQRVTMECQEWLYLFHFGKYTSLKVVNDNCKFKTALDLV